MTFRDMAGKFVDEGDFIIFFTDLHKRLAFGFIQDLKWSRPMNKSYLVVRMALRDDDGNWVDHHPNAGSPVCITNSERILLIRENAIPDGAYRLLVGEL